MLGTFAEPALHLSSQAVHPDMTGSQAPKTTAVSLGETLLLLGPEPMHKPITVV